MKSKNRKRHRLFPVCLLAVSLLCAAGCSNSSGTIVLEGSSSMEKTVGILSEAYMEKYPEIRIGISPTGSTSGIRSVLEGRSDIGLSSRKLTREEKNEGLQETLLALDGIAVIVNRDNPVRNLSSDQLRKIYSGQITSWADLGGEGPIVLISREAGSGTRDGFEQALDLKTSFKADRELTSAGDIQNAVLSNPNAIGYISLANVDQRVQALSIDGVFPDEPSVSEGRYAIARPFLLITRAEVPLSQNAQNFEDYMFSAQAKKYIAKAGVIHVR